MGHAQRPLHRLTPEVISLGVLPDLTALHALNPLRYPVLLESTAAGARGARHDILMAFPGEALELAADGTLKGPGPAGDFLGALDAWLQAEQARGLNRPPGLPFAGGWFVYLAYEFANEIEPRLRLAVDDRLPLALAVRIPVVVIRDPVSGEAFATAEPGRESRLGELARDLDLLPPAPIAARAGGSAAGPVVSEEPAEKFLDAVHRAQEHISAGDVYQINLSRAWSANLPPGQAPLDIYRALRHSNPAPFAGIARIGGGSILSSSPERLLRISGQQVQTRPIAGTRARNGGAGAEERVRAELLLNAKERAEHVMLIDLERNDLGRVCKAGSVQVDEFMTVESYAHVHHIVSNVSGHLRPDATPAAVLRAIFPGGTITGCPKIRCMELIRDLEDGPRGCYTGSMGYLGFDGDCDLNILIRTMYCHDDRISFRAGSGIVADSDPARELDEARAKARGMLLALAG